MMLNFLPKKWSSKWSYKMTYFFKHFSPKSLDEFWLSVYKSCPMIDIKAINIMVPFASYGSASKDFML